MSNTFTLLTGDSLIKLKTLPDNSIDSIVTDPPYELGFMGKVWDKSGISYNTDLWKECFRVLKHGGHLLAFGGSRTYHRLAVAIEDAGFDIRDQIMWIYGCLSEDTEILTENGWKHYDKSIANHPVLCYDVNTNSFTFDIPTEEFCYENEYPAYSIKSNFTDQLVSRHHRVLVERGGRKEFVFAEELSAEENLPFLESLSDLPDTIPNLYRRTSITKQDLLQRVSKEDSIFENGRENEASFGKTTNKNQLCSMQQRGLETSCLDEESENFDLLLQMQRNTSRNRVAETRPQGQGKMEARIGISFEESDDWCNQSSLEGWYNLSQEERELQGSEVCEVSSSFQRNVNEGRLHSRTQTSYGTDDWQTSNEAGSSSSYRPQFVEQRPKEFDVISKQCCTQKIRGTRAKITEVKYKGKMWCVSVPTGAFVARRNGKIFITGNSGFPKSHNISKAIDKKLGAEREIVGSGKWNARKINGSNGINSNGLSTQSDYQETASGSEEAKYWEGYGTALKPAHEPIVMARKPLEKGLTIVENVLKYGTGAINIDGCRISHNEVVKVTNRQAGTGDNWNDANCGLRQGGDGLASANPSGRFPANLIHDGSDEVEAEFVKYGERGGDSRISKSTYDKGYWGHTKPVESTSLYNDTGTASRFFYSAKTSNKDRNEGCEDLEPKEWKTEGAAVPERVNRPFNPSFNNHPTVKPTSLMRYLVRLITPKDGTVLDPFTGSGSTGKAALLEGFNFIGIEIDLEYVKIAEARCAHSVMKTNK